MRFSKLPLVFILLAGAGLSTSALHYTPKNIDALAEQKAEFDQYFYEGDYYNSISNTLSDGEDGLLRKSLTELIYPKGFYKYGGDSSGSLSYELQKCDEDPSNPQNMILLYTRDSIKKTTSSGGSKWNREHVWPQSLSNGHWGQSECGTDLLHLRPTYGSCNSSRGNSPYAEITNGTERKYSGMTYGYAKGDKFMPLDSVKGDVARIIMYIWVAYCDHYVDMPEITSVFESFNTLIKWHIEDLPDELEGNRNNYVETSKQQNRNPFVDHPEYAWRVWGDKIPSDLLAQAKATYPLEGRKPLPDFAVKNQNGELISRIDITDVQSPILTTYYKNKVCSDVTYTLLNTDASQYTANSVRIMNYPELYNCTIVPTKGTAESLILRVSYSAQSLTQDIPINVTLSSTSTDNGSGCSGSILGFSAIVSTISLSLAILLILRRKRAK